MKKALLLSLAVLFLINILNFYDRNVAGALAEPMKKEFSLSDSQIGMLGSVFIWIYAIVGVPLGFMADRMKRKTLLASGIIVWSILTAMNAFAQNYTHLLLARLGVGIGEAVVAPSATSWIGDLVPTEKRARALALFMLGVPVGGALSYFFSGPIAQRYGWRTALVIAALPAILLVPPLLFLREPERGASDAKVLTPGPGEPAQSMWSVLRIPTLLWIIASGALLNFNMYAYGTFTVSFLMRIHGQPLSMAGILTGVIMMAGGVAGGLIAGRVGDQIVGRRKDGRLLAAALFALGGAPLAYLGIVQPKESVVATVILLALAYGSCNTYYGLVYSSIHEIVAPSLRATTMAIYFMFMYLCGASMGPLLTGAISDWRARVAAQAAGTAVSAANKATGLQEAMLVIPLLGFLLAVVLYAGSRTISRDISRRESLAVQTATV